MSGDPRFHELAALVDQFSKGDGVHATAIPGLQCLRMSAPSMKTPAVYTPCVCVVVQGSKRVLLEEEIYRYSPSQYLAVSVDLPLLGQVIEASADKPYLCLQINLDPRHMSELIAQSGHDAWEQGGTARGMFVGKLDDAMMDTVLRLARLLHAPKDIPALAPMTMRELHYRLLSGAHGAAIAQIAIAGSTTQKIAQVIRRMKSDLAVPMRIEELAAMAHMSPSSFHQHFRAITAMSPLQYLKRLRLTEARQIMLSEPVDAASTAYRVGYESASQFSREYARMFGAPPMRDIAGLRSAVDPMTLGAGG
jgi:AraC-like DNA-binding protein